MNTLHVSKIEFSSLKDPISTKNWNGIYFIQNSSGGLGYIGKKKRGLKARVGDYHWKEKIKKFTALLLLLFAGVINIIATLQKLVPLFSYFLFSLEFLGSFLHF